jgi:hypothetical protein
MIAVLFTAHSGAQYFRMRTLVEQGAGAVVQNVQMLLQQATQGGQQRAAQGQPQQQAPAQVDPAIQARAQILRLLETVLSDPENVSPEELRGRMESQFKEVVKTSEDKKLYRREIIAAYECQKDFLQDALNSVRMKKPLKSKARQECEGRSGQFYFREKLVTPEQAAANDGVITQLAKGEKIPNPAKNNTPWDEDSLRSAIYLQQKRIDAVSAIFR